MSKKTGSWILIAVIVLIVVAAVWFGGPAIWRLLLAMHGRH
ncbi:MAG TPA: hypothetical protein VEO37_03190 [Thermoanaerobaculia bacterium]|nr:hypothetical protein [Thermoanaerobaculia bacterium]